MANENKCPFNKGDKVTHISNPKQLMVVTDTENFDIWIEGIECKWITKKGKLKESTFTEFELIKNT